MTTHPFYLAGPMTGYKDFNFPAFNAAAEALRAQGLAVLNPAENFEGRNDLDWETYVQRGLEQVREASSVLLLPGWEDSVGAQREVALARRLDKPVNPIMFDRGFWKGVKLHGEPDPSFVTRGHPDFEVAGDPVEGVDWVVGEPPLLDLPTELEQDPPKTRRIRELEEQLRQASEHIRNLERMIPHPEDDESVLQEAQRLVHGPRRSTYDHPLDNHERIAKIWSGILGHDVTAEQTAMCMIGVKLSREAFRAKRDNRTDMAGYALVLDEIVTERARREE